jgi:hypothetical protein
MPEENPSAARLEGVADVRASQDARIIEKPNSSNHSSRKSTTRFERSDLYLTIIHHASKIFDYAPGRAVALDKREVTALLCLKFLEVVEFLHVREFPMDEIIDGSAVTLPRPVVIKHRKYSESVRSDVIWTLETIRPTGAPDFAPTFPGLCCSAIVPGSRFGPGRDSVPGATLPN